jgi:hypothetical protein
MSDNSITRIASHRLLQWQRAITIQPLPPLCLIDNLQQYASSSPKLHRKCAKTNNSKRHSPAEDTPQQRTKQKVMQARSCPREATTLPTHAVHPWSSIASTKENSRPDVFVVIQSLNRMQWSPWKQTVWRASRRTPTTAESNWGCISGEGPFWMSHSDCL